MGKLRKEMKDIGLISAHDNENTFLELWDFLLLRFEERGQKRLAAC